MPLYHVKRVEAATVTTRWVVEAEDEVDVFDKVLDWGELRSTETSDHELVEECIEETEECSDCGTMVSYIIGCPDGAEICQACFDAGREVTMSKIFTVARDGLRVEDTGCVRLLVNTDIPYSDEAFDRLADAIEAIDVPDTCAKCEAPESEHALLLTDGVDVLLDKVCPGQVKDIDSFELGGDYGNLTEKGGE